ncbi:TPA: OHCU decarboxylase, partial [Raoultella ornithinolytica]|nr:OHCU decarboxylase [Raoultella ornithinolytica]
MIPLTHFNQLPPDEAARLLEQCVAIDSWVTALVQARPYPDLATLHAVARQTS